MKKGNIDVLQVSDTGAIYNDKDVSLTPKEIYGYFEKYWPQIQQQEVNGKKLIVGFYNGKKYAISCKNVTYLGIPHPIFKKRIQISGLQEFYDDAVSIDAEPLLMGIYVHGEVVVFVNFGIDTYLTKKAHNSSAHVYADDLLAAYEDGFFQKIDFFGNVVTAFNISSVDTFLEDHYSGNCELTFDAFREVSNKGRDNASFASDIVPIFKKFFGNQNKQWDGILCYKEMISANYKNAFQAEWPGFYLEFRLSDFLLKERIPESKIKFAQNKSQSGVDLDLYFSKIRSYGDLKMHSDSSSGVQGNDLETVKQLVFTTWYSGHLYYIVCEHATKKDNMSGAVVTHYWNKVKPRKKGKPIDLTSYIGRMKNSVMLKKVYFLDINKDNWMYLGVFKQGKNADGHPREPKIKIDADNFQHFVIEEMTL